MAKGKAKKMLPMKGKAKKKGVNKVKPDSFVQSGATIGKTLGEALGRLGGTIADKIFGSGDYIMAGQEVQSNSIVKGVPVMHSSSEEIRFRRREYITDVSTQAGLVVQAYSINPGLQQLFPFLSGIAQNFQQYSIEGLMFEYRTTCADAIASTNSAMGSVIMAVLYENDEGVPATKAGLLNLSWACDAKPSQSFLVPLECARSESVLKNLYIRSGPPPSGQPFDYDTHDMGRFLLATVGAQASFNCGELWVTYDVVLRKPIPPIDDSPAGGVAASYHGYGSSVSAANPLGLAGQVVRFNNMSVSTTNTTMTVTAPFNGVYQFSLFWYSVTAYTAPTFVASGTGGVAASQLTMFTNGANGIVSTSPSTVCNNACSLGAYAVTGATASASQTFNIVLGTGGTFTGGNTVDIILTYLGPTYA